jgi:hypothetical protein
MGKRGMISGRRLGVASALAFLLVPTSSGLAARTVAVVPDYITQGPVLAGNDIAWQQEGCLTNCFTDAASDCMQSFGYAVKVAFPDRTVRTLATGRTSCFSSGPSGSDSHVEFAISATHLAIGRSSSSGDDTQTEAKGALEAGPRSGSLTPVYRCVSGRYDPRDLFVLSGKALLFDPEPCRESVRKLTIRDLSTGEQEELPVETNSEIFSVDFADRYVAYLRAPESYEFEQIVVYDRLARVNSYTVEVPPQFDQNFALRPDGTLALSVSNTSSSCATDRFEWYSPTEPFAHPFGKEGCIGGLDFAGERVLYSTSGGRLEAQTLGGEVTPIANFGPVPSNDGFDADGRQVTYSLPRCDGGYTILVHQLVHPPASGGPPRCPARVRSSTIRVREAYARVRLRCPRGCQGQLRLSHRGRTIARRPFRATRRTALRGVRVQLFVGSRSRLRRAGHLPTEVHLLTRDRTQKKQRLTRRVVLKADTA